ncbi:MAG TPA: hypothetical protein VJ140_07325 [Actinomycetota bacterium]|nr:hypothetical protein [Actinomycetota bacterium]
MERWRAAGHLVPDIATTRVAGLPADPAEISRLPVFSPAISQQVIGRIMTLIAAMQALLGRGRRGHPAGGGVDVDPGAAQELSVLHAVACTTAQW